MRVQKTRIDKDSLPDISEVGSKDASFSLRDNLENHLDWVRSVPHEQAVQAEVKKLRPLFSAMIENIENGRARKYKTMVKPHELEAAFVRLARKNNSLILCDMPITMVDSLERRAGESNTDSWSTNAKSSTFFPPKDFIRSYRGWGFIQVYRDANDTRVSLPVLGLSDKYSIDDVLAVDSSAIGHMQTIGRLSNHDWLHHMTMTNVNNLVAHTHVLGEFQKKLTKVLSNIPRIEGKTIEGYEALCVKTHSNLLQTESARPLWESLKNRVGALSEDLHLMFERANKAHFGQQEQYKAINYLAITTARILRRVEPIEGDMTQKFLKSVVSMPIRGSAVASEARSQTWGLNLGSRHSYIKQATSSLRKQYDEAGLFTRIYEKNAFSAKVPDLVEDIAVTCRAYGLGRN
jgi:hypothetical protein